MNFIRKTHYTLDVVKRLLIDCGLLRSIWSGSSIDARGRPLPWLSMPAIHLLQGLKLPTARVFEFGSGNSTLYWQRQMSQGNLRSYAAAEYDLAYADEMSAKNGFYRDHVYASEEKDIYLHTPFYLATNKTNNRQFFVPYDIFFVDGPIQWRKEELQAALLYTCSEGLIFVDDSNWLATEVEEVCSKGNLCRIDLAGFSPGVSYQKVTSLLFRNPAWLHDSLLQTPVGGMSEFPGMS